MPIHKPRVQGNRYAVVHVKTLEDCEDITTLCQMYLGPDSGAWSSVLDFKRFFLLKRHNTAFVFLHRGWPDPICMIAYDELTSRRKFDDVIISVEKYKKYMNTLNRYPSVDTFNEFLDKEEQDDNINGHKETE